MSGSTEPAGQTRRELLVGLAVLAPAASFLLPADAAGDAGDGVFMATSRIVTGNDRLSPEIGRRIEAVLVEREAGFADRLQALSAALRAGGARAAALAALDAGQVDTALRIAKPWYLGWLGTPSQTILQDDAVFATFLEAQSFDKILAEVPRPTYPGHDAGWWGGAPPGVTPPPMPADVQSWNFRAGGPARPRAPDPRWRGYAAAAFASIDEARAAKP